MEESHFIGEIVRAAHVSFFTGVESKRSIEHTSETELEYIRDWTYETIERYLLLESILTGRKVLELEGGQIRGRRPTEAETVKLRECLSTERRQL